MLNVHIVDEQWGTDFFFNRYILILFFCATFISIHMLHSSCSTCFSISIEIFTTDYKKIYVWCDRSIDNADKNCHSRFIFVVVIKQRVQTKSMCTVHVEYICWEIKLCRWLRMCFISTLYVVICICMLCCKMDWHLEQHVAQISLFTN